MSDRAAALLAIGLMGLGAGVIYMGTRVDRATTVTDNLGSGALGLVAGVLGGR